MSIKIAALFFVLAVASAARYQNPNQFIFRSKPYVIVSNEKASWFDAESLCVSRGLQLASVDDDAEFSYIRTQITARGLQNEKVWIGGTEIGQEDNYYWTNSGSAVELDHWDVTEIVDPKNRCMVFYKGTWRHNLCSAPGFFICETPEAPTTTPPPAIKSVN